MKNLNVNAKDIISRRHVDKSSLRYGKVLIYTDADP